MNEETRKERLGEEPQEGDGVRVFRWLYHRPGAGRHHHLLDSRIAFGQVEQRWQFLLRLRSGQGFSFGFGRRPDDDE